MMADSQYALSQTTQELSECFTQSSQSPKCSADSSSSSSESPCRQQSSRGKKKRLQSSFELRSKVSNQTQRLAKCRSLLESKMEELTGLKSDMKKEEEILEQLEYKFETAISREKACETVEMVFGASVEGYAKNTKFVYALRSLLDGEVTVEQFTSSVKDLFVKSGGLSELTDDKSDEDNNKNTDDDYISSDGEDLIEDVSHDTCKNKNATSFSGSDRQLSMSAPPLGDDENLPTATSDEN